MEELKIQTDYSVLYSAENSDKTVVETLIDIKELIFKLETAYNENCTHVKLYSEVDMWKGDFESISHCLIAVKLIEI